MSALLHSSCLSTGQTNMSSCAEVQQWLLLLLLHQATLHTMLFDL
jgi:hypothetical protein